LRIQQVDGEGSDFMFDRLWQSLRHRSWSALELSSGAIRWARLLGGGVGLSRSQPLVISLVLSQLASAFRVSARPGPAMARRPSTGLPAARPLNSPKNKRREADKVLMGEINSALADLPESPQPLPGFEAALNRWKKAFEESQHHRQL